MRHRRPRKRVIAPCLTIVQFRLKLLTVRPMPEAPEHKAYPSPAGHPALRSDASRCDPRYTDFERITQVLREGYTSAVYEWHI